jgi:hypothetical protein
MSQPRTAVRIATRSEPLALSSTLRREVAAIVPGVTIVSLSTADAQLGGFKALRRLQTWLLAIFASLTLVLAAVGILAWCMGADPCNSIPCTSSRRHEGR